MSNSVVIKPFEHLDGFTDLEKLWWAEAEIERLGRKLVEVKKERDGVEERCWKQLKEKSRKYQDLRGKYVLVLKTNVGLIGK